MLLDLDLAQATGFCSVRRPVCYNWIFILCYDIRRLVLNGVQFQTIYFITLAWYGYKYNTYIRYGYECMYMYVADLPWRLYSVTFILHSVTYDKSW